MKKYAKKSMRNEFHIIIEHKFWSLFFSFVFFTLFVSLMSCIDFNAISKLMFFGGIITFSIVFLIWKEARKKVRNFQNEIVKENINEKRYELKKLALIILMLSSLVSIPAYCLFDPIQSYAANVVEYIYPKAVQNFGEKIVESIEEITTGSRDKNGSTETNVDNVDNVDNVKYIACATSEILVSTYEQDYDIDKFFLSEYFYGINERFRSYEVSNLLNEKIYSLFNKEKSDKPNVLEDEALSIQNKKNQFLKQIERAQKYINNSTKWKSCAPTSDELIDICNSRENLIRAGYHDFRFCFLLSNNFQRLGNEYLKVSNDSNELFEDYDAILYYYCKSIEADKMALTFSTTVEERNCCLERIFMRYQDIGTEEGINIKIREAANIICKQLREDMNL